MLLDKKKVGMVTKVGAVIIALAFIVTYIPFIGSLTSGSDSSANQNAGVANTISALEKEVQKSPKSATAWLNLANAYYDANQWDRAAASYQKVIEFEPKNVQARVDQSIAFFGMGQLETATASIQEAVKIDPKFGPAYYNLGVFLSAQGKAAEAINAYEQYLKVDTSGAKAKEAKGQIDVLKKQVSSAPAQGTVVTTPGGSAEKSAP